MRVLPSPQAITRMEEAITWNQYLERDDARLMWERAGGMPWKHLCHRFGISQPTATRRWGVRALRHRLAAQRPAGEPEARARLPDPAGQQVAPSVQQAPE